MAAQIVCAGATRIGKKVIQPISELDVAKKVPRAHRFALKAIRAAKADERHRHDCLWLFVESMTRERQRPQELQLRGWDFYAGLIPKRGGSSRNPIGRPRTALLEEPHRSDQRFMRASVTRAASRRKAVAHALSPSARGAARALRVDRCHTRRTVAFVMGILRRDHAPEIG